MALIKPKKSFGTKSKDSKSKDSSSKDKPSSSKSKPPPSKSNALSKRPVKTKRPSLTQKKKPRVYTDKELALPKLNMITPAGVTKPKGKKKGKIFVDDPESMRTILAMVSAEREGKIESKMQKARQMEELREARRAEQEKKDAQRKEKLEEVKDGLRKKRRKVGKENEERIILEQEERESAKKGKKRVSFG